MYVYTVYVEILIQEIPIQIQKHKIHIQNWYSMVIIRQLGRFVLPTKTRERNTTPFLALTNARTCNWDRFLRINFNHHHHHHPCQKFYGIWYAFKFSRERYFSWKFSNADRSIYLLSDFLRATKTFNQPSITLQPPSTGCINIISEKCDLKFRLWRLQ